jgi:uncharacterized iron-regulated membrane protein
MHRWLGLWAGLWLAFTGATGTLLVLAPELEESLHPELYHVQPSSARLPLGMVQAQLEKAYPGHTVVRLDLPQSAGDVDRFLLDSGRGLLVLANPYSGQILGARPVPQTWTGWLHPWHTALIPGAGGEKLQSLVAAFALTLLTSGWLLSQPSRAALGRGIPRRAFDWHRWLGWLSTPGLVVASLTGACLVFYAPLEQTLSAPLVARYNGEIELARGGLDQWLSTAQRALPEASAMRIQLAKAPGGTVNVRMRHSGEPNPNGRSYVRIDPASGAVLAVEDARRASLAGWLLQGAFRAHTGQFCPMTRAFVAGMGLTPAALWLSGMMMRRRRLGLRVGPEGPTLA